MFIELVDSILKDNRDHKSSFTSMDSHLREQIISPKVHEIVQVWQEASAYRLAHMDLGAC